MTSRTGSKMAYRTGKSMIKDKNGVCEFKEQQGDN